MPILRDLTDFIPTGVPGYERRDYPDGLSIRIRDDKIESYNRPVPDAEANAEAKRIAATRFRSAGARNAYAKMIHAIATGPDGVTLSSPETIADVAKVREAFGRDRLKTRQWEARVEAVRAELAASAEGQAA